MWQTLRRQRNMRVHVSFVMAVAGLGWILGLGPTRWAVVVLAMVPVMGLELMNTAVEAVVDMASPHYHPLAKVAKDAAAGSVLVAAAGAVAVGLWVFLPALAHFGPRFMVRWHENAALVVIIGVALLAAYGVLWSWVPATKTNEGGQNRFGEQ